jgi:hypothetical protein
MTFQSKYQEQSQQEEAHADIKSGNPIKIFLNKTSLIYNKYTANYLEEIGKYNQAAKYYKKAANNASNLNHENLNKHLLAMAMNNHSKIANTYENVAELMLLSEKKANYYNSAAKQRIEIAFIADKINLKFLYNVQLLAALKDTMHASENFAAMKFFQSAYETSLNSIKISRKLNVSYKTEVDLKKKAVEYHKNFIMSKEEYYGDYFVSKGLLKTAEIANSLNLDKTIIKDLHRKSLLYHIKYTDSKFKDDPNAKAEELFKAADIAIKNDLKSEAKELQEKGTFLKMALRKSDWDQRHNKS